METHSINRGAKYDPQHKAGGLRKTNPLRSLRQAPLDIARGRENGGQRTEGIRRTAEDRGRRTA